MTAKKQREIIYAKYSGRCAYCETPLTKGWHVNYLFPPQMVVNESGKLVDQNATLEKSIPACQSCSMCRGKLTIRQFKEKIQSNFDFVRQYAMGYNIVKRFGFIEERPHLITFLFEKENKKIFEW